MGDYPPPPERCARRTFPPTGQWVVWESETGVVHVQCWRRGVGWLPCILCGWA